ncbi:LrgB family protein [Agaribacterium sp. ZY112]|uniref:LrgB family protein n=1 Tax=Agaribacterium sp. ZY112 TaxID=3233574 RepID=UPI0035254E31
MSEWLDPALMLLLTVVVFLAWRTLQERSGQAWMNALLLSIATIVAILLFLGIDYARYWQGAQVFGSLVEPVVVALGYPLYKQLRLFARHWKVLVACSFFSVIISLSLITLLARLLAIPTETILSLSTLNVTTAVAMETSAAMGGQASLAALCVMIAGFTGAGLGQWWLSFWELNDERVLGFAIGAQSHALGAATLATRSAQSAAWASASLILCALLTALFAPHYIPFLLSL